MGRQKFKRYLENTEYYSSPVLNEHRQVLFLIIREAYCRRSYILLEKLYLF